MDDAGIKYVIADISEKPKAFDVLGEVSRGGAKGGPTRIVTPTTVVGTSVIVGGDLDAIKAALGPVGIAH